MPETDSDSDPGVDIQLKIGTVIVGDLDPDRDLSPSLCNGNSSVQYNVVNGFGVRVRVQQCK